MTMYEIHIDGQKKEIYSGHLKMGGANPYGEKISFNNYYMELNGRPFFGIVGEFHFSRYPYLFWEESICKMKAGGIHILATYVIWNYHEEREGEFDWSGNNNLRHFLDLCAKHDMKVILRIGPFSHGEVRNGGIPDWLYGRPFEIRSNDPGYLAYAEKWYNEVGRQVKGLMYKDGGPVVGIQLENEHMHAGAPWELAYEQGVYMTTGRDGAKHLVELKKLAIKAGLVPAFFTATAWGNASVIESETLPMLAGYAFTPWNPDPNFVQGPTDEYIFRDLHSDQPDKAEYNPKDYPLAFCEMGGGIQITYHHRPIVPPESVEAMAVVKIGSGANLIGYYMYHGGTNRVGQGGVYLNEFTVPKLSYDFQAPIREFGQIADSYRYLKTLHMFLHDFGHVLAPMKTTIPAGGDEIRPEDAKTLRYCIRSDDHRGFIFINNYQDHVEMQDISGVRFKLNLPHETLEVPLQREMTVPKHAAVILPFNFAMGSYELKYATAQLMCKIENEDSTHYFFYAHEKMGSQYAFKDEEGLEINSASGKVTKMNGMVVVDDVPGMESLITLKGKESKVAYITTLTREQALKSSKLNINGQEYLIITDADLYVTQGIIHLTKRHHEFQWSVYPALQGELFVIDGENKKLEKVKSGPLFETFKLTLKPKTIRIETEQVSKDKMIIRFPADLFEQINDVFLQIDYTGDTGNAFIEGRMVSDHFYNGILWEIGLKRFKAEELAKSMYIYISPLRKGKVEYEINQAYRKKFLGEEIAEIHEVRAEPEYKVELVIRDQ